MFLFVNWLYNLHLDSIITIFCFTILNFSCDNLGQIQSSLLQLYHDCINTLLFLLNMSFLQLDMNIFHQRYLIYIKTMILLILLINC